MKKGLSILAGLLTIALGTSQAQITNDKGTFTKPGAGEWAFETQIAPNIGGIGGIGFFNLNDPQLQRVVAGLDTSTINSVLGAGTNANQNPVVLPALRMRRFIDATTAHRLMLNVTYARNSFSPDDETTNSNSLFGIALGAGIEKHQAGAERLSTYYGADAVLAFGSYSAKSEFDGGDGKIAQSGIGVGVRVLTGADYYFIPKVYLGLELGWGISFNTYGKLKGEGETSGGFELSDSDSKASNLVITPHVSPTFRLGFRL